MTGERQKKQHKQAVSQGRLLARPLQPTGVAPIGLSPLGLSQGRDGLLYVPTGYKPDRPAPLILMLHGAGGKANHSLAPLLDLANALGLILLAPDSRHQTWDVLYGEYGSDIDFIDQALAQTFSRYAIDPANIAVAGFSDGASYALSIGIINGELFNHIIAFSPGFIAPTQQQGWPQLFVSHGTRDRVLSIDRCSRKIVPVLQQAGYEVVYREFEGGHTMPSEIVREALDWLIGKPDSEDFIP